MAKKRSYGYKKRQMMKMRKTCKIVSVLVYFSTAVSFCSELKKKKKEVLDLSSKVIKCILQEKLEQQISRLRSNFESNWTNFGLH